MCVALRVKEGYWILEYGKLSSEKSYRFTTFARQYRYLSCTKDTSKCTQKMYTEKMTYLDKGVYMEMILLQLITYGRYESHV